MLYINKSAQRDEGNKITKNYLLDIWLKEERRYPVDYDGSFKSLPSKENSHYVQMTNILLQNQNCHCCYCMRRLTGVGDTTLEHIVPQSATAEDFEKYRKDEFPYIKNHLILSDVFSKKINPPLVPRPHTVSYDNLVASCKGLFPRINEINEAEQDTSGHTCNNVRGNKEALPIYLLHNVSSIIKYQKNGDIVVSPENEWCSSATTMIISANLTRESLTDIRRLWYVFKNVPREDILSCKNEDDRLAPILDNLYLTDIDRKSIKRLSLKFKKEDYWKIFLLYDWFHTVKWDVQ